MTVVFKEEHMVERVADGETGVVPAFELQEYYDHPERYRGRFERYLPHLDMLVNAYNYLDLVPKGRDEDGLDHAMAWVRHHDRYGD